MTSSYASPSSSPVPFLIARSMVSPGTLFERASTRALRSRGLAFGSPPPRRAATVISRKTLVNTLPRRASVAALRCLIVLHLLWPDIALPPRSAQKIQSIRTHAREEMNLPPGGRSGSLSPPFDEGASLGG